MYVTRMTSIKVKLYLDDAFLVIGSIASGEENHIQVYIKNKNIFLNQ